MGAHLWTFPHSTLEGNGLAVVTFEKHIPFSIFHVYIQLDEEHVRMCELLHTDSADDFLNMLAAVDGKRERQLSENNGDHAGDQDYVHTRACIAKGFFASSHSTR